MLANPNSNNDFGGVHTNSGVQNYWYHILVMGGTHNGQIVSGIGFDDAIDIVHRGINYYIQQFSDYHDSREVMIQAAKDLYGKRSNQVKQVINAWHAVGVGQSYDGFTNVETPSITICTNYGYNYPYEIDVTACPGSSFSYALPIGWSYNISGNSYAPTINITNISPTPSSGTTETIFITNTTYNKTYNAYIHFEDCSFGLEGPVPNSEDEKLSVNKIDVYPTITENTVNVEGLEEIKKYDVYRISGELLKSNKLIDRSISLDGISSGLIILRLVTKQNKSLDYKIFKI